MRELRFVRLDCESDDAVTLLLESGDGTERFSLPVDETLRLAVRIDPENGTSARQLSAWVPPATASPPTDAPTADAPTADAPTTDAPTADADTPIATPAAPRPEVHIAPRDVQVRIRGGESPQELADALGVGLERILRFAQPVMDERRRIAGEARRARARRPDAGDNATVVFGEVVDERFIAHGISAAEVTWDSHRREDGDWVVAAEWLGGQGRHCAEWVFHRTTRSVTPIDDTASELLSDRPIRPLVPAQPEPERPSLAFAPRLAPGVVAFPPMADANTGPLPRLDDVYDQNAPADGPRDVPPFVPAPVGEQAPSATPTPPPVEAPTDDRDAEPAPVVRARRPVPAALEPQLEFEAPPLPLGITDPATRPDAAGARPALASLTNINRQKRVEPEEERAARARIPSWDDILLGVRRKQD